MSEGHNRPSPLQRGRVGLASARAGRGAAHQEAPPLPAASGSHPPPQRGEGREIVPDFSGRLAGDTHILPVRVYYEDTDFSGLVYHASYLRFLERGRTEFLRAAGVDQSVLHAGEHALVFAVRRMVIEWLKPARMDDVVEVETRTHEVRGASLTVHQAIRRGPDILLTAEVKVAALAAGRPTRIPDTLRAILAGANLEARA